MENQNVETFLRIYGPLAPKWCTYSSMKKITNSWLCYRLQRQAQMGALLRWSCSNSWKGMGRTSSMRLPAVAELIIYQHLLTFTVLTLRVAKWLLFTSSCQMGPFKSSYFAMVAVIPLATLFNIPPAIARVLDYLHWDCNERILQFDIKTHNNVFLDEKFCPKISYFGVAWLCPLHESAKSMPEARGTLGYIALL